MARGPALPKVRFIAARNNRTEPTMISRLTAHAVLFAVLGTASLAFAASLHQEAPMATSAETKQIRVVQLERVVVTAKRLPQAAR
ncbi:MAG: hypothetical protein ABUL50_00535 [Rhizobacter sp.]